MSEKVSFLLTHSALFVIFFWFGLLKLFGVSPVNNLVQELLILIPIMNKWPFDSFIIFLGLIEMCIAVLFLFKRTTKFAVLIIIPHLFTTMLPLVFLPYLTWQSFMVPTLAGQYIIKNIVIATLVIFFVLKENK